jgi:uncharacterized ferritin-like protein (DUF455 family)
MSPGANLYLQVQDALLETDPGSKSEAVGVLYRAWSEGILNRDNQSPVLEMDVPGRPNLPQLVNPRNLDRRSTKSTRGRTSLMHAIAHIEFNAINIALDAVYRFRQMPDQFVSDWLLVASEESRHFKLINQYLLDHESFYGAFEAHNGLWELVVRTRDDVLHRMALVPRVMEARGLDVTPAMISRLTDSGDQCAVEILQEIYRDEVGHVRIGNYWFQFLCKERQLNAIDAFRKLVDRYLEGNLRGPFNWPARLEAGFEVAELEALEQGLSG